MTIIGKIKLNPPINWRELKKGDRFELVRNKWQYIFVGESDQCGSSIVAKCVRNNKKILLNKGSKLRIIKKEKVNE